MKEYRVIYTSKGKTMQTTHIFETEIQLNDLQVSCIADIYTTIERSEVYHGDELEGYEYDVISIEADNIREIYSEETGQELEWTAHNITRYGMHNIADETQLHVASGEWYKTLAIESYIAGIEDNKDDIRMM